MQRSVTPCQSSPVLSLIILVVLAPLAGACDSAPPVSPSPAASGPQASPAFARYLLSGHVTDEDGMPIVGAVVEVDHGRAPGSPETSSCPSIATFCWLNTLTNEQGLYTLEFEGGPLPGRGIGYVYSLADGHEVDIQWVPTGSETVIQDLRLPRVRPLLAGESTSVSVGPDSTLCSDLEDTWVLGHRCTVVRIEANTVGTLLVEARAATADGIAPFVFWATSGNYNGPITRPGPGTVSIPIRGGTYQIFVGLPDGSPSQSFDVVTSLR